MRWSESEGARSIFRRRPSRWQAGLWWARGYTPSGSRQATNLTDLALKFAPQLKRRRLALLGTLAGFGLGLMMFLVAVIIGGIIMAFGESGSRSTVRIAERIFGPGRGANIAQLCTATIRTVAQGVIGIAFAQMLLIGVGFVLMGVPGAGLLALGVLLLGIGQLPASLITLPVIGYVFATCGASPGRQSSSPSMSSSPA